MTGLSSGVDPAHSSVLEKIGMQEQNIVNAKENQS